MYIYIYIYIYIDFHVLSPFCWHLRPQNAWDTSPFQLRQEYYECQDIKFTGSFEEDSSVTDIAYAEVGILSDPTRLGGTFMVGNTQATNMKSQVPDFTSQRLLPCSCRVLCRRVLKGRVFWTCWTAWWWIVGHSDKVLIPLCLNGVCSCSAEDQEEQFQEARPLHIETVAPLVTEFAESAWFMFYFRMKMVLTVAVLICFVYIHVCIAKESGLECLL